mmetsp:Transcript_57108/g.185616  ORF Transcript_57108/g.185616 Transcript_57108/m.185616 type:complete len:238 (+) Transcript_57108:1181-1894(+)
MVRQRGRRSLADGGGDGPQEARGEGCKDEKAGGRAPTSQLEAKGEERGERDVGAQSPWPGRPWRAKGAQLGLLAGRPGEARRRASAGDDAALLGRPHHLHRAGRRRDDRERSHLGHGRALQAGLQGREAGARGVGSGQVPRALLGAPGYEHGQRPRREEEGGPRGGRRGGRGLRPQEGRPVWRGHDEAEERGAVRVREDEDPRRAAEVVARLQGSGRVAGLVAGAPGHDLRRRDRLG